MSTSLSVREYDRDHGDSADVSEQWLSILLSLFRTRLHLFLLVPATSFPGASSLTQVCNPGRVNVIPFDKFSICKDVSGRGLCVADFVPHLFLVVCSSCVYFSKVALSEAAKKSSTSGARS